MGRYDRFDRQPLPSWRKRWEEAHPLWGPLGCLFAVILLVLSYALAALTLQNEAVQRWVAAAPGFHFRGIAPDLVAKILFTLVYGALLYGLLGLIYAALLRTLRATPDVPWDLRAPVRRPRKRLLRVLQGLAPVLGLGMALWSVLWMKSQPWYRPIPALQVPGPVPDLFFYVLAFGLWYYLFQVLAVLLNMALLALLKALSKAPSAEDDL